MPRNRIEEVDDAVQSYLETHAGEDPRMVRLAILSGQAAAQKCMDVFRRERKRQDINKLRAQIAKDKLRSYRMMKMALEETECMPTVDDIMELYWGAIKELMEKPTADSHITESKLERKEASLRHSQLSVWNVDRAMRLYGLYCDQSGTEEDKRRVREVCKLYIQPESKTVREVAEEENLSEKAVYKDVEIACKVIGFFMFQID